MVVASQAASGQGLRMRLSAEPDLRVVGEARDCSLALAMARLLAPDVVLVELDIIRADEAGQLTPLAQLCRQVPVIILTFHSDTYAQQCMQHVHAAALVDKLLPVEALLTKIREVSQKRLVVAA